MFNVGLPTLILSKGSDLPWLGPVYALLLALTFPIVYALYDLVARKKWNLISGIGLFSVLTGGGLGLWQVDGFWFAVKEAFVPSLLGIYFLMSARSKLSPIRAIF